MKRPTVMIIDSNALIHRAYHALPPLTTKRGEVVNALYGFLLVFFRALRDIRPDYVFAAFDLPGPTFRHKEHKEYKATRVKAPDELYSQIPLVKDILKDFNVPVFEKEGFEADDVIGALSLAVTKIKKGPKPKVVIVTGDLDTLQLVDETTSALTLRKGIGDSVTYGEKEVRERFGFSPEKLVDYKGLRGDPSDNISGVPGVGEKTASALIRQFGSLENLYDHIEGDSPEAKSVSKSVKEKLIAHKEAAFFSRKLATIRRDLNIDFDLKEGTWGAFDADKVKEKMRSYEFFSLLDKIPSPAKRTTDFSQKSGDGPARRRNSHKNQILTQLTTLKEQGILSKKLFETEKALIPVVEAMERAGVRVDVAQFRRISEHIHTRLKELEASIYAMAGAPFNINSPQQVSEVLFTKLHLPAKGLKKTPGGAVSTASDELTKLQGQHPIVDALIEYRELMKLKTTYIDTLPLLANPKTGRLHTTFHQLGTATGRMSSSNPNMQNIPIRGEWGKEIRRAFVPEKGYVFLSADYSQMELRVAAAVARDAKMIRFFKEGKDIHRMTASQIFNVPEEKVDDEMRALAKTLNFGVLYGMGPQGFKEAAHVSAKEAKEFIAEYMKDFSGIASYVEETKKFVFSHGYAQTRLGRKRFIPEIMSSDPRMRRAGERIAINLPIQGLAADIMKMAMVKVFEVVRRYPGDIRLVLQVHDELLFEVKPEAVSSLVPPIREAMENVYTLGIPLVADFKTGPNWGDMEPFASETNHGKVKV